jgi:hypothetical protein
MPRFSLSELIQQANFTPEEQTPIPHPSFFTLDLDRARVILDRKLAALEGACATLDRTSAAAAVEDSVCAAPPLSLSIDAGCAALGSALEQQVEVELDRRLAALEDTCAKLDRTLAALEDSVCATQPLSRRIDAGCAALCGAVGQQGEFAVAAPDSGLDRSATAPPAKAALAVRFDVAFGVFQVPVEDEDANN